MSVMQQQQFIISLRFWSILNGISFMAWDVMQIVLTCFNVYNHDEGFVQDVDHVLVVITRLPTIVAGGFIIFGGIRQESTPISIGMYTVLEALVVSFVLFLRNYKVYSLSDIEFWSTWISFCVKTGMFVIVYHYHKQLKENVYREIELFTVPKTDP